ncbi:MAG TPA: FCD domain-containing protein, partial [Rubellimicrobium sp.]|nr:FCD domain-containing protein [Rubellimicrobium sp.]
GDTARFYASDEAFHRALCDASGIAGLWGEIGGLKAQLDRVRNLDLRAAPALPVLIDQHEALRAAVAAGDGQAAEAALRAHLRRVIDGLPGMMMRHPDHFEPEDRAS